MNLIACIALFIINSNFYALQFQDIDGNARSMSEYQGKKVLLVNIATGGSRVNQLAGLQQLHQQYGDSLIIIAFPSNSLGGETRTNEEIKQFCQSNYGVSFVLASKIEVTGPQIHPVYSWLTNLEENGISGEPLQRNFQKFLVSESGQLVGFFSPGVEPMDQQITSALSIRYDEDE